MSLSIPFLGILLAWTIYQPMVYAAETSSAKTAEIRSQRFFRSASFPGRLLAAPRYLLALPWVPAKRFINFSERTDLFARIRDLFYFNEAKTAGWFPAFSSEGLEGAAGLSLFHHDLFRKKHRANASFTYAAHDEYFLRSAYAVEPSSSNPNHFKAEAGLIRDQDVEIFARTDEAGNPVLGAKTNRNDKNSFSLTRFQGKITGGRQISKTVALSLYMRGERVGTGKGKGSPLPLPPNLQGLDDTVGLVGGGTHLVWDFRDTPVRPFYGCLVQANVEALASPRSSSLNNDFGFTQYSISAEHFLPIYDPHRALVFRHSLARVDPLGGRKVPFYAHPILDLNHFLRSFERNRFQDRGALSFNLEYRYPIWVTWDAYVFFDGGQTFEGFSDLRAPDFRFSEGVGIRFMSKDKLLFVLQFGTGREDQRVQFSLGQVF